MPDFVANAGAAGLYGLLVLGDVNIEDANAIFTDLSAQVRTVAYETLKRSREVNCTPREAAIQTAHLAIKERILQGESVTPWGMGMKDLLGLARPGLDIQYFPHSPYAIT